MTVSTILAGKGREVVSVEPSASLADAVRLLAGKRIGAAVILGADRRIAGIISERDIVRVLAERGAGALDEPVSQTMTRKVETCNESETVSSLMERMTSGKFRHMPVVDRGRVVGIVSIGDIVKHRLHEMERESAAMRDFIMSVRSEIDRRVAAGLGRRRSIRGRGAHSSVAFEPLWSTVAGYLMACNAQAANCQTTWLIPSAPSSSSKPQPESSTRPRARHAS